MSPNKKQEIDDLLTASKRLLFERLRLWFVRADSRGGTSRDHNRRWKWDDSAPIAKTATNRFQFEAVGVDEPKEGFVVVILDRVDERSYRAAFESVLDQKRHDFQVPVGHRAIERAGRAAFASVLAEKSISFQMTTRHRGIHRASRASVNPMAVEILEAPILQYDSETLGRSVSNGIPLERAWQMEFYKASYRCTPSTCVASADVGALFGSAGFIDFTVHCGDDFWGIELLREGSKLDEDIARFAPGGRYSLLELSDYCLIDFRRVSSMDETAMAAITADLNRCEKLYVVCYDPELAHVSVLNAEYKLDMWFRELDACGVAKIYQASQNKTVT